MTPERDTGYQSHRWHYGLTRQALVKAAVLLQLSMADSARTVQAWSTGP